MEPKVIAPHTENKKDVSECAADTLETFCKETKKDEGIMILVDRKRRTIEMVGFGKSLNAVALLEELAYGLKEGQHGISIIKH